MAVTIHASQVDKAQSPYQLDPEQTLRASQALLSHVQAEAKRLAKLKTKKDLLAGESDSDEDGAEDVKRIWLNLGTKQQIVDKARLEPSKITVPNSLNTAEEINICLITADPQRAVKNAVADPTFPSHLSSRITRIIGFSKLSARYKSFEQKRQLLSEHDIFLADDRIVTRLPNALGKIFYKGTGKRPVPISLMPSDKQFSNKPQDKKKSPKSERGAVVAAPTAVAKEIEKALSSVPVTLSPGHQISVRVGLASFSPQQLADNIAAVTNGIIEKHVVSKWRNVRSIHIKSPTSFAVPIWLADDLWSENNKVTENLVDAMEGNPSGTKAEKKEDKKRKRSPLKTEEPQTGDRKKAKLAEARALEKREGVVRKQKLAVQKAQAFKDEE